MATDKKEISSNDLKTSFKNLTQLIENINNAISLGIMKIDKNTVYIFKGVWNSWSIEAKNGFIKNIIAFFKVKYNTDPGLNIYINDIESNEEIGFIMTDLKELVEAPVPFVDDMTIEFKNGSKVSFTNPDENSARGMTTDFLDSQL